MRIRWVKVWVDSLASLTERFRDEEGRVDFEALGREEYAFRHALATGDFSRSERARDLYDNTINEITSRSEAGRKGAEARWSKNTAAATTREGVDDFPDRESGASERTNGCNSLTADAPTREDVEFKSDSGNAGNLESATSATHYGPRQAKNGDTATREGAEVVVSRESGVAVPTTVSRNMRRVPQNEAPAHGFSGGRTAQGTMYRSPEAAAQSGKDYDKETSPAVAGVNLDSHHTNKSPDASSGNAEGMITNGTPTSKNGCRAACTSATSGQTFEAPLRPGAGEVPPENLSAKPSTALPVPSKRPHGEFGNVLLTDDEFTKLAEKLPNVWDLITELDQYIESQGKTRKYKSHYATLLNWSRRKAQESKQKNGYKTAAEKDADVLKELAEYYDKMEAV